MADKDKDARNGHGDDDEEYDGSEYEDSGEGEESGEDEEEEEEEPKLRYHRLGASVTELLRKDAASCMAVHEKFLALGTHWGAIHILDFSGNEIKHYSAHSTIVNEISIDSMGDFIASCSDDGKVSISSLYSDKTEEFVYHRPVTSVALDPDYARKNTNRFVCGGKAGQLVMNTKGWLGHKDTVLHSGEGPIHAIKWQGSYIAWANDVGVKIYDCQTNQRITYIDRPKGSPRPDMYKCNLCWIKDTTLIIGWADSVKIAQIRERTDPAPGLPPKYVEITGLFQTDYYISGVAPFGDYLVLLAYVEEEESQALQSKPQHALRPELRIVDWHNVESSSDALTVHGFESLHATDYRLAYLTSESLFFVVSPKDVVVARPRDLDDHVSWLLERAMYDKALEAVKGHESQLKEHKPVDIGEKYLDFLVEHGKVQQAAALCPSILKKDQTLWEKWIYRFVKIRELRAISEYIPIGNPELTDTVYEMVLNYFLTNDSMLFLKTITEWPHKLYNIQNVITAVRERLKYTNDDLLMDALAKLYTFDKQYDKTLHIYLKLKRGNAFELIQKFDLFDAVQDKAVLLMEFNEDEAIKLLINNIERIPIPTVVNQLSQKRHLLHKYLHALFNKDPHIASDFHELQVSLYADYEPSLLLPFLKQSNYYPLVTAYQICESRHLYPEMVYLLGRMGNHKQALSLVIDKLADVKEAIEFVQSQNDEELWEDLIAHSMNNPAFISGLLENIGAHVDPIKLIKRIPNGMQIIGLRDRLVKIISDYNLQMSLREGCKEILKADCVDLFKQLIAIQKAGIKVEDIANCATCLNSLMPVGKAEAITIFFCSHIYHQKCMRNTAQEKQQDSAPLPHSNAPRTAASDPNLLGGDEEKQWCNICHSVQQSRGAATKRSNARNAN